MLAVYNHLFRRELIAVQFGAVLRCMYMIYKALNVETVVVVIDSRMAGNDWIEGFITARCEMN